MQPNVRAKQILELDFPPHVSTVHGIYFDHFYIKKVRKIHSLIGGLQRVAKWTISRIRVFQPLFTSSTLLFCLSLSLSLSSVRFAAITATTLTFTLSLSVYKMFYFFFIFFSYICLWPFSLSRTRTKLLFVLSSLPLAFFLYTTFLSLKLWAFIFSLPIN